MAKKRRSILVAIFQICHTRSNRCSACTAPLPPLPSTSSLLCTSGCHAYHSWLSNPTALSRQRPLIRAARQSCGVVGNTVNTQGNRPHNHRADDHLVYSPYNGDVHSPGKRPLCSICRRRRHASCCCCSYFAQLIGCE